MASEMREACDTVFQFPCDPASVVDATLWNNDRRPLLYAFNAPASPYRGLIAGNEPIEALELPTAQGTGHGEQAMAVHFSVGEVQTDARFVIRLDDPQKIAHARAIIDGHYWHGNQSLPPIQRLKYDVACVAQDSLELACGNFCKPESSE